MEGSAPRSVAEALTAILRGEDVAWRSLRMTVSGFLEACAEHELTGLVQTQLRGRRGGDWPAEIRAGLDKAARSAAASELVRCAEITSVLGALDAAGVHPILFKGTALAYSVYAAPSSRPRGDTDLLVRPEDAETARRVLFGLGYAASVSCDAVLCQSRLTRIDRFGLRHDFDVHWNISSQAVFSDLVTYAELAGAAVPIPALGPHARAAGPLHALLVACVHPVMHHRNVEMLAWVYDMHLLASRLSAAELDRFADLARVKKVGAICASQLAIARERFSTRIPDEVTRKLAASPDPEPSAKYLEPGRRWRHELASSVRAVPHWSARLRLLAGVAFPSRRYMMHTYGLNEGGAGQVLVPALYVHRLTRGLVKVLAGLK